MKYYQVTKVNEITEEEIDYGIVTDEEVTRITRGYKNDIYAPHCYQRKGSKYFFNVSEITAF